MTRVDSTSHRYGLLVAAGLIALTLAATSCGLTPTHTSRGSDQWSNGKLLGTALLNNRVALEVDEAGNAFIVWVGLEHELAFARLDERAEVIVERPLDLWTNSSQKPELLMDPTGQMHLTWLDRREQDQQVFYSRLSGEGEVLQEATALSLPEQRAADSSMVLDLVGRSVEVFWSDNAPSRPGCYHAALDWSGGVIVPAEMLMPKGILPAAQADRRGFVHLAWREVLEREKPRFNYAVYDPRRRVLGSDAVVSEPLARASALGGPSAAGRFRGPRLGLDKDSVYLAWVLEVRERGGLAAFTFYQAFPQPALSPQEDAERFDYALPDVTGEAVRVEGANPALTGHPRFLDGQPERQVLTCYTQVSGPGNMEMLQIAAIDVQAGQIEGQEIVNASSGASLQPNVAVDSSGQLHLAWIDTAGFERYRVVFASTSPQAKETLNRVTAYEVVDKGFSMVMNVFSALFFIPVVLSWVFLPIAWLVAFSWATNEGEVWDPHGRIGLGVAMLLQLGIKLIFFGDLLSRLPFASLLTPSLGSLVGRWALPVCLAGVSTGAAWAYVKCARGQSIFATYFIYAGVDSFLTLVAYVAVPMM